MRQTHGSWLMAHASHGPRPTSHVPRPFSHRRPLSVMTTTKRRHFPMLLLLDLRLLSCTAWGNRVVLPHAISSTGAIVRIKTAGGAHESAARCFYSYEKGRHCAGPVHGGLGLVGDLRYGHLRSRLGGHVAIARAPRCGVLIAHAPIEGAFDCFYYVVLNIAGA